VPPWLLFRLRACVAVRLTAALARLQIRAMRVRAVVLGLWLLACCRDQPATVLAPTTVVSTPPAVVAPPASGSPQSAPETAAAEKRWRVEGMPTIVVVDSAGREVGRITSASDLGQLPGLIARASY